MKQKKVRLLGLLLAAVMLFSCLPVQALAAEGGWFTSPPTGTEHC